MSEPIEWQGEKHAVDFLRERGYVLWKEGFWERSPYDREPTAAESSALVYLRDTHDYRGLSPRPLRVN